MAKNSFTISDFNVSNAQLAQLYHNIRTRYRIPELELDRIFAIALNNRDLFPNITLQVPSPGEYLFKWVKGYIDAMNSRPSTRVASPKGSCSDPAIKAIVKASKELTDAQANEQESHHNLFMSAENIQGNLLEEYISNVVRQYGWLWCNGNVLRSVDFCNTNGSKLLQVKNKSNTENSSSSAIRQGTTIEKWFRLGTKTVNGNKLPDYKWDKLNLIINTYSTEGKTLPKCLMNEDDYLLFLDRVTHANKNIITER
ncbi:MAG TPA: SinI family restriction endonuclease [Patescibacteria group bacterium]|nr:SinI family restriction endonuclease [Patescibacteria group bacterium]